MSFSTRGFHPEDIQLAGQSIATQPTAKCLGYWWHTNFSPVKSIQENICKAHRAYFALGSIGAYQGLLNPLSGRSLFTTFVLPILLYGSDNWILTEQLLMTLEKFQAEIGRRILRLSKSHSDVSVLIGLHWPRIRVYVLLRKLAFLVKLLQSNRDNLSSRIFRTMASDDIHKISLIEQCQFLEDGYDTSFVADCLNDPENAHLVFKEARAFLLQKDWTLVLEMASQHHSLKHVLDPRIASSWAKLWDFGLDYGYHGTKSLQSLYRVMTRPVFGDRKCPSCEQAIDQSLSYLEHVCSQHNTNVNVEGVIRAIEGCNPNILTTAKSLSSF